MHTLLKLAMSPGTEFGGYSVAQALGELGVVSQPIAEELLRLAKHTEDRSYGPGSADSAFKALRKLKVPARWPEEAAT